MGEKKTESLPTEKPEKLFKTWLSPPGVKFKNPEAEKAYQDRIIRIKDVIQLKVPDRVPVYVNSGFFPVYYAGISPDEVKAYCKKLIDVAGKDGGSILAPGASIDDVNPENLRAMVDFTKEYGIYS